MASGTITKSHISGDFYREFFSSTPQTTGAGGYTDYTFDITRLGYTPIGIVELQISGASALAPVSYYIQNKTTAILRVTNTATSQVTPTGMYLGILFVKD